jgi:hypothetical protein
MVFPPIAAAAAVTAKALAAASKKARFIKFSVK